MTKPNCPLHQPRCGLQEGNPVCPKCGLDERSLLYVSEEAAMSAKADATARYAQFETATTLTNRPWMALDFRERPRLPGGRIDVDNECLIIAEDLDFGNPPSYQGVLAAGKRRLERVQTQAESGDTKAMLIYGRMLLEGFRDLPANPSKAHYLFRQALELGDETACAFIGILHETGSAGLPKDAFKAREWYERGAVAKDGRAMSYIGELWAEGSAGFTKNREIAIASYIEGAQCGSGTAMMLLAEKLRKESLEQGDFLDQLYRMAFSRGEGWAAFGPILCSDGEYFWSPNQKELIADLSAAHVCDYKGSVSIEWFESAVESVDVIDVEHPERTALFRIGAQTWAEFGSHVYMYKLAQSLCASQSPGEQADAAQWLEKSAIAGYLPAMHAYGGLLLGIELNGPDAEWPWIRDNLPEAFRYRMTEAQDWWARAAAEGQICSAFNLGKWLSLTGKAEDQTRATQLLEQAVNGEECILQAYYFLVLIHSNGFKEGWQPDPVLVERYSLAGAEKGVLFCMDTLARILYRRRQYKEALQWFTSAAEAQHAPANVGLAKYHINGAGPGADPHKARDFAERAAEAGEVEAMVLLGLIYRSGIGIDRADLVRARYWLSKAAEAGDESAKVELVEMDTAELAMPVTKPQGFLARLFGR